METLISYYQSHLRAGGGRILCHAQKVTRRASCSPRCRCDVADILQKSNVDVKGGAIDAVIWSHHHLDHTGNMATFPGSTQLIVGPGFKDGLMPRFPVNPESHMLESDFEGRKVVEVGFEGLKIGGFRANDYFGDGSFYLLDAPGHAIGHLCALARVTEDTFIFMGADACHHGGEFRPTEYLLIPEEVNPGAVFDHASPRGFCPRSLFEKLTPHNKPFYQASENAAYHYAKIEDTIMKLEAFDAAENVWVVIAHDRSLLEPEIGVEFFPTGTLNSWKKDDLAEKTRWTFLKDFEVAAKAAA